MKVYNALGVTLITYEELAYTLFTLYRTPGISPEWEVYFPTIWVVFLLRGTNRRVVLMGSSLMQGFGLVRLERIELIFSTLWIVHIRE